MWNLKNKSNELQQKRQNRNRLIQTKNKLIVALGKGLEGWVK